ncbi:hypothetical protein DDW09_02600 [Sulfolobus sp. SCGC AB-777_L09]|jgi:hypothetical protein|nr:hypothetical protein DDW09_02600 [Sulfolobus sp. SCGC AB-777_L09]
MPQLEGDYLIDIKQILSLIKENLNINLKINANDPLDLQRLYEFLEDFLDMMEFMRAYKLVELRDEEFRKLKEKIAYDMQLISERIDQLV